MEPVTVTEPPRLGRWQPQEPMPQLLYVLWVGYLWLRTVIYLVTKS